MIASIEDITDTCSDIPSDVVLAWVFTARRSASGAAAWVQAPQRRFEEATNTNTIFLCIFFKSVRIMCERDCGQVHRFYLEKRVQTGVIVLYFRCSPVKDTRASPMDLSLAKRIPTLSLSLSHPHLHLHQASRPPPQKGPAHFPSSSQYLSMVETPIARGSSLLLATLGTLSPQRQNDTAVS